MPFCRWYMSLFAEDYWNLYCAIRAVELCSHCCSLKCWWSILLESLQYIFWMVDLHSFYVIWSWYFCSSHWRLLLWLRFLAPRMALDVTWWPWISIISDRNVTCKYILQEFSLWSVIWDEFFWLCRPSGIYHLFVEVHTQSFVLTLFSSRDLAIVQWNYSLKCC